MRFWIPLLYYAAIGFSLQLSRGHFDDVALILIGGGWLVLLGLSFWPESQAPKRVSSRQIEGAFWVVLTYFTYKLLRDNMVHDVVSKFDQRVMKGFLWAAFVLSVVGLGSFVWKKGRADSKNWGIPITIGVGVCLFLAKVFVLRTSPDPFIDVFRTNTLGAEYFWKGLDPYSQSYPDLYKGFYGYRPGFFYWPSVLVTQAICWKIFGDIRVVYLIGDLITAASLFLILRSLGWKKELATLGPVLWLAFPAGLFVLEQAWIDPLLVASGSAFVALLLRRSWIGAGIALGFFCATKQHAIFYAVLVGVLLLTRGFRERRAFVPVFLSSVATFLILAGPFLLWDAQGFCQTTILEPLGWQMRTDSLSFIAAIQRNTGSVVPGSVISLIYLAFLLGGALLTWKRTPYGKNELAPWASAVALVYGATFLFGKIAFCNYYYLLGFFVLLQFFASVEPVAQSPRIRAQFLERRNLRT